MSMMWSTTITPGAPLPETAAIFFGWARDAKLGTTDLARWLSVTTPEVSAWKRPKGKNNRKIPEKVARELFRRLNLPDVEWSRFYCARLQEETLRNAAKRFSELPNAGHLSGSLDEFVRHVPEMIASVNQIRAHRTISDEIRLYERTLWATDVVLKDLAIAFGGTREFLWEENIQRHAVYPASAVTEVSLKWLHNCGSVELAGSAEEQIQSLWDRLDQGCPSIIRERIGAHCLHVLRRMGEAVDPGHFNFAKRRAGDMITFAHCQMALALSGDEEAHCAIIDAFSSNNPLARAIMQVEKLGHGQVRYGVDGAIAPEDGRSEYSLYVLANEVISGKHSAREEFRRWQILNILENYMINIALQEDLVSALKDLRLHVEYSITERQRDERLQKAIDRQLIEIQLIG